MVAHINWGILSPGKIAHQFAQAIQVVNDTSIMAVASATPGKANSFAEKYNIPNAFSDYQQLLACDQIDAVYIASVHSMHAEQVMSCLKANIPVLCEKPITVNQQLLSELIDIAVQKKIFLMEALWTRFLPVTTTVKAMLDKGEIGQLECIESSFGFIADTSEINRLRNPDLAGGVLLDLGIYPIALSQFFTNSEVVDVQATAKLSTLGIDEQLQALLKYANGVTSSFSCSFNHSYQNTMRITGNLGTIEIKEPFWGATQVILVQNGESEVFNLPHDANGFEYQIRTVVKALQSSKVETEQMTLADSMKNMRVMDEIRNQIGLHYPFE